MYMYMLTKRANILFEEQLWQELLKLAGKREISVGQLVREMAEEKLADEQLQECRRQAVEEIKKIRPHFKGKLDYKALINYGRKH